MLDRSVREVRRAVDLASVTSTTLLRRAVAAEPAAWAALVKKYGRALYVWCVDYGVPKADAPDVVQEVLAKVARKLDGFHHDQEGDTFRGWLRRISERAALDYLRRRRRFVGVALGGEEGRSCVNFWPSPKESDSSSAIGQPRLDIAVQAAGIGLRDWSICRELLSGASAEALAQRYGLQVKSVYVIKFRVIQRLRKSARGIAWLGPEPEFSPGSGPVRVSKSSAS